MLKITKKQQVIELVQKGDLKSAYRIAKSFTREFSKDSIRTIQIAYECLTGKDQFYKSIGVNTEVEMSKAKELLLQYK